MMMKIEEMKKTKLKPKERQSRGGRRGGEGGGRRRGEGERGEEEDEQ